MTGAETLIRITDLRHPVPTDAHRRLLGHFTGARLHLTVENVLSAAQDNTGLSDFGPDDFRPRLHQWLEDTAHDAGRTPLGHAIMFQRCVRLAGTRLRLQHFLRCHPEIGEIEIRRPIIVVGPPRSGTTHLVNLLAADSRLRSLSVWENDEPIPSAIDVIGPDAVDPRRVRCGRKWRQLQELLPHLPAIHAMEPDNVDEEIYLQGADFAPVVWKWWAYMHPWPDTFTKYDHQPHYEFMKTVLKALQWQRGPDRWVLKSPHHAEHLDALMTTFPDATVVITHRDPVAVVQSIATMSAYRSRLQYHEVDTGAVLAHWTAHMEKLLTALIRDAHLIPPAQRVEVMFHELMADQMTAVRRIYEAAGLELTEVQRMRMAAFVDAHPRDRHGRLDYDLRDDFGVTPQQLRSRFTFYRRRFPTVTEVA